MKKTYLVAGLAIVIGIALLFSASQDASTYSSFQDAEDRKTSVKVIGELVKEKEMIYDPAVDPNYFSFYVKDQDGVEKKVVLASEKPQDFELSEQIVMTGKMRGGEFMASELLLKCPSKYKDEEVVIKGLEDS